jgi:hypothetical protein
MGMGDHLVLARAGCQAFEDLLTVTERLFLKVLDLRERPELPFCTLKLPLEYAVAVTL